VGEETEDVSVPEFVAHEAWCGWKECLRMAHTQQRIGAMALQGKMPLEPWVCVKRMTEEEWDQFEAWKMKFLSKTDNFEEDSMEVDAFGMYEWCG